MTSRERALGYAGAALAAVGFAALYAAHLGERSHAHDAGYLVIGLVMASVLAAAIRTGSRYFAGFAAIIVAAGPWGKNAVYGFPFLGLGGWYLLTASRLQRERTAERAAARRAERAATRGTERDRPTRKQGRGRSQEPSGPRASKRYTPPKPPRRRPAKPTTSRATDQDD